jgi:hypothetical protein
MSNDTSWITARLTATLKGHPPLPEPVAARLAALLNGELQERQLPSTEVMSIAKALLADMRPAPPVAGPKG